MSENIVIKGARTNNLKNISLNIPKNKITVITGVSGSGKSSLIFDTLAAESQRLLNETYSSYIQQLLPHYKRPEVDEIKNLPVSIVINQKKIGGNPRSTVGTVTDIYTSLRLLYSRIAKPFIGYSMVYSFNNPSGMCPKCKGIGEVKTINIEKLIDFKKSLNEGAINFPTFQPGGYRLSRYTETGNFDNDKKLENYNREELNLLLYDIGSKPKNPTSKWPKTSTYIGVIPRITKGFIEREDSKYSAHLNRILEVEKCPECLGTRVNERVRSAKINNVSIADCVNMNIDELLNFLNTINSKNVNVILEDLKVKLKSLELIGLGYLTLNRSTNTLSGGESQRIKMTRHLNSSLSDILYILDEPSIGLHPEDIQGINKIIQELRNKGNTVVLADHDPDIIKVADYIVNIGEGSGESGGEVTFQGTYEELVKSNTVTGRALSKKHSINKRRREFNSFYSLENVSLYNIKNVSVKIPKNAFTVVTGVAGAGKSTLIQKLFAKKYEATIFNQNPIVGSNRSNVLTYLNVFDRLRKIYSGISNESVSLFSFNGKGACPECKGRGYVSLDLAFMGDVQQVCEKCNGKRYSDKALEFKYKGKSIYEVLQLTVEEAINFIEDERLIEALQKLIDVNLSYVKLGQSIDTFSGGELQRLKLAKVIDKKSEEIFILDEPSTGLHEADIDLLIKLFKKILSTDKTLIVLEHNLSIISSADWIVDIGPKAGNRGGKVLFQGYPLDLLNVKNSYTAKHLKKYIEQ
ncbi:excinuclease ABC, A subunit [Anaerosphaera aminiphila DSM 21120]|uniref:UvrABC system protein A n=1 Tax=Anaerosphaera aminiphila DSM 21120 TaxID=1120995 RepID=A0A1M5QS16_9FIRM|nr:excinuclease ABC subunit UvrA [Anaerosphaera aminiphila]SHH16907.1 excinuclease ABC, A subunit [Anaerosphaera aminiphila DSM 21120]